MKLGEVVSLSKAHMGSKWQSQDLNPSQVSLFLVTLASSGWRIDEMLNPSS